MNMNLAFGPDPYLEGMINRLHNIDAELTDITLHGCRMSKEVAVRLAMGLAMNRNVKKLDLRYSILEGGIATIANVLLSEYEKINLNNNNGLRGHGIEEFIFQACGFDDDDAEAMANLLQKDNQIRVLKCGQGSIMSENGIQCLLKGLLYNNGLDHLDLSCCSQMNDQCMADLANLLRSKSCTIKTLNLTSTRISNTGAQQLASALKSNCTVQTLHLSRTRIAKEGVTALLNMLRNQNTTLRSITRSYESTVSGGCCWDEIDCLLAQNRAGRALLQNVETPASMAPLLLARANKEKDPHVMFSLLRQVPHVWTQA
jgi:hypothetical protein